LGSKTKPDEKAIKKTRTVCDPSENFDDTQVSLKKKGWFSKLPIQKFLSNRNMVCKTFHVISNDKCCISSLVPYPYVSVSVALHWVSIQDSSSRQVCLAHPEPDFVLTQLFLQDSWLGALVVFWVKAHFEEDCPLWILALGDHSDVSDQDHLKSTYKKAVHYQVDRGSLGHECARSLL
jgi:hypothetical protein